MSSLLQTGFPLVAVSGATLQLRDVCFSLRRLLTLRSTGSRARGLQQLQCVGPGDAAVDSRVWTRAVAHRLSCPVAPGIFPDQGLNPALVGKFLTNEPPGKASSFLIFPAERSMSLQ